MMIGNYNFAREGWQCPVCKRVNAPWMPSCSCGGEIPTFTSTGTTRVKRDTDTSNKTEGEE